MHKLAPKETNSHVTMPSPSAAHSFVKSNIPVRHMHMSNRIQNPQPELSSAENKLSNITHEADNSENKFERGPQKLQHSRSYHYDIDNVDRVHYEFFETLLRDAFKYRDISIHEKFVYNWDKSKVTPFEDNVYILLKQSHTDLSAYKSLKSIIKKDTKLDKSVFAEILFLAAKYSAIHNTDERKFMDILIDNHGTFLNDGNIFSFRMKSSYKGNKHSRVDSITIRNMTPLTIATLYCMVYQRDNNGKTPNMTLLKYLLDKRHNDKLHAANINSETSIAYPLFQLGRFLGYQPKVMTILDFVSLQKDCCEIKKFLLKHGAKTHAEIKEKIFKKNSARIVKKDDYYL